MSGVLGIIWNTTFAGGVVFGAALMKLYQWQRCRRMDKAHPLPGGRRRRVGGISPVWAGGGLVAVVMLYVFVQMGETETLYRELASNVSRCQDESARIAKIRADITAKNDDLSVLQRDLLGDLDDANGELISLLYQRPALGVEGSWANQFRTVETRAFDLRTQIKNIRDEQSRLTAERTAHPPPAQTCGKAD